MITVERLDEISEKLSNNQCEEIKVGSAESMFFKEGDSCSFDLLSASEEGQKTSDDIGSLRGTKERWEGVVIDVDDKGTPLAIGFTYKIKFEDYEKQTNPEITPFDGMFCCPVNTIADAMVLNDEGIGIPICTLVVQVTETSGMTCMLYKCFRVLEDSPKVD